MRSVRERPRISTPRDFQENGGAGEGLAAGFRDRHHILKADAAPGRIVEAGFREPGVLESLNVDHVDEAHWGLRPGVLLPAPYRKMTDVTGGDRSQPVRLGLVQVGALLHEDVDTDLP